ncbi:MAG: VOC family protein [Rhodospirillales bacterium]|nr:VOC family protein [Rhodospirillales bacterium]
MATKAPHPRLTHFALFATDVDKMVAFYQSVLGLIVTDKGQIGEADAPIDMVFMSNDPDEHHQFVLLSGRPDGVDFALNQQLSFLVDDLDQLRTVRQSAREAGVETFRESTHGNAWSIYFSDPEGNMVEIYVHSPWYIPQPHITPIDLDQSNEEIMRFTEAHCRAHEGFMSAKDRRAEMAGSMGVG